MGFIVAQLTDPAGGIGRSGTSCLKLESRPDSVGCIFAYLNCHARPALTRRPDRVDGILRKGTHRGNGES